MTYPTPPPSDPYPSQENAFHLGQMAPRRGMSTGSVLAISITAAVVVIMAVLVAVAVAPPRKPDTDGLGTPAPYDAAPAVPAPTSAAPATTAPKTTAPATPAAPAGPLTTFGEGTYEIGTGPGQVKPGKYRTTVPGSSGNCYWQRLKGTSGQFSDIIANDNADTGTPVIVTISASDVAFSSEGCGTWGP